ncbi:MAG: hypothetical protein Q7T61_00935 [Caulobacter sp.]|nr:hypothetical protein [Caulobacter sp.]
MVDTTLAVIDGNGDAQSLAAIDGGVSGLTPYHAEDPAQRTALLAAFAGLGTQATLAAILAKLLAAPSTEAKQDTLIGHVDGLETLVGATNALLTTQNGYLDGIEGLLTTANGYQDGIEALLTTLTRQPTTTSRIASAAASTNATSAKTSAGTLFFATGYNAAASVRYLKIYNKASAPTVGTDVPVLTLAIPASAGFAFDFPAMSFATGIAYALTTGAADSDTGALTLADIVGLNIGYA